MEHKKEIEMKTKAIMADLEKHIEKYSHAEEIKDEFRADFGKIIELHIKSISKMKLFNENLEQLKETMIKFLDARYLPKVRRLKPVLTDDELLEKRKQAKKKREELKEKKAQGTYIPKAKKAKKKDLFVIPILHSL